MNITSIIKKENYTLSTKDLASGYTKVTILNRKAYGEKYGIKGKELKRKHSLYLAEQTNSLSGDVSSQFANGNLRVVGITQTRQGFNIQTKTKQSIYGASSFDHGAIAQKEKDDELKAKDVALAEAEQKLADMEKRLAVMEKNTIPQAPQV